MAQRTKPRTRKTAARTAATPAAKVTVREAAVEILTRAGQPLKAATLADAVLKVPGIGVKAKNPKASVLAQLAGLHAHGGPIERVAPGTYTLRTAAPVAGGNGRTPGYRVNNRIAGVRKQLKGELAKEQPDVLKVRRYVERLNQLMAQRAELHDQPVPEPLPIAEDDGPRLAQHEVTPIEEPAAPRLERRSILKRLKDTLVAP